MIEKEYKVMLTEKEYNKINAAFAWTQELVQANHYYLDANSELRDSDITLRIRELGDKYFLQTKIRKECNGSLSIKEEQELYVDSVYKKLPLEIENQILGGRYKNICRVGKLVTLRKIMFINECEICLDLNRYLSIVDYELEIEFKSKQIPNDIICMFQDKFAIFFQKEAIGKSSRFFKQFDKNKILRGLK